ncbi:hypothetical protein [Streptomyces sp. DSM 40750]|uniref:hypothetical protein n=1 Tax=Streptomyces sp. DSM 40750 TaxID=2801030 RepID=UPI00214A9EC1|nr:hypothetical protein [Streptomyces sp. DSM 40750]UUU23321.1 hypothetical protein JIX55_25280 [Streptomyces sp. DSM 40750]
MAPSGAHNTHPPDRTEFAPVSHLEDIRNLLGLLLAGFAGAVNIVGLRNAEITTLLRNQGILIGLAGVLLLAALGSAIASVFVSNRSRIPLLIAGATVAATLAVAAFSIYAIKIPKSPTWTRAWILGVGIFFATATVAGIFVWLFKRPRNPNISLQLTLLLASAVLISSATSAFIRIEAKNQAVTSLPQLDAATEYHGSEGVISLKISAAKLRDTEWIYFTILGVPHGIDYDSQHPCLDSPDKCEYIADGDVNPNSVGAVEKNLKIPFSPLAHRHLEIRVTMCESMQKGDDCDLEMAEKVTSLDIRITRPQP